MKKRPQETGVFPLSPHHFLPSGSPFSLQFSLPSHPLPLGGVAGSGIVPRCVWSSEGSNFSLYRVGLGIELRSSG